MYTNRAGMQFHTTDGVLPCRGSGKADRHSCIHPAVPCASIKGRGRAWPGSVLVESQADVKSCLDHHEIRTFQVLAIVAGLEKAPGAAKKRKGLHSITIASTYLHS